MPAPTPPYRVAFGERLGQESYILQSSRGVAWCNINSELENLLHATPTLDVLDFSLGSGGRYYVKYRCRGIEKRKLSKGLWDEIQQNHQNPLDRLTLGETGQYWGVKPVRNEHGWGQVPFGWAIPSFQEHILGQTRSLQNLDAIKFVALGSAGEWAFNANGRLFYGAPESESFKKAMRNAKYRGREVLGAAFSRVDPYWLIIMDDGSVDYHLASAAAELVQEYMRPEYMLPHPEDSAPSYLIPLSSEDGIYNWISGIFHNGWQHHHKSDQEIEHIYSIQLPESLNNRYDVYRSNLIRQGHGPLGGEELLFHGTPRACYLGNSLDRLDLCPHPTCNLCGIIRTSFQVSRSGTAPGRNFLRFGHGIYTTSVSSKADDYNDEPSPSDLKAMIVARVALGRSAVRYQSDQGMIDSPHGFTSVIGEPGDDLNYDEQVVYCDDAIRPAYLVVYGPRAARGDYGGQY